MRISWLCALVMVAGCGSVSSKGVDGGTEDMATAGGFTLAVPASINVPIASSANVTLTVQRDSGIGDITLTTGTLPAHITVTFATNPVPEGTDTTDVTIAVAGGSAAGTNTITLIGTAGALTRTVTLDVTAQTITVTGRIATGTAGTVVGLVGKSSVTSDATGNFTFTDVTPPYDLYTYRIATQSFFGGGSTMTPSIVFYDNLTRPDPVVRVAPDIGNFPVFFSVTNERVVGSRSGTGNSTSPSAIVWSNGYQGVNPGSIGSGGTWDFQAQWFGNATTNMGTLFGLQWTMKASGAPDQYIGFGSAPDITLTSDGNNNTTSTTVNLTFVNPTEAGLVGTITPPAGYNAPELQLNQQFGNTTVNLWKTTTTMNAASSIVTGTTLGKAAIYALATSSTNETSSYVYPALTAATDVGFAMPAAAVLETPVAGATNIDTTSDFTITATPGALFVYSIVTGGAQRASYTIYSEATTVRIPNVSERALPLNQTFSWSVAGYGPFTVNAAATMSDVPSVIVADYTGTKRYQTQSVTKTFTSKP